MPQWREMALIYYGLVAMTFTVRQFRSSELQEEKPPEDITWKIPPSISINKNSQMSVTKLKNTGGSAPLSSILFNILDLTRDLINY